MKAFFIGQLSTRLHPSASIAAVSMAMTIMTGIHGGSQCPPRHVLLREIICREVHLNGLCMWRESGLLAEHLLSRLHLWACVVISNMLLSERCFLQSLCEICPETLVNDRDMFTVEGQIIGQCSEENGGMHRWVEGYDIACCIVKISFWKRLTNVAHISEWRECPLIKTNNIWSTFAFCNRHRYSLWDNAGVRFVVTGMIETGLQYLFQNEMLAWES